MLRQNLAGRPQSKSQRVACAAGNPLKPGFGLIMRNVAVVLPGNYFVIPEGSGINLLFFHAVVHLAIAHFLLRRKFLCPRHAEGSRLSVLDGLDVELNSAAAFNYKVTSLQFVNITVRLGELKSRKDPLLSNRIQRIQN